MALNGLLWIVQGMLALVFLFAGGTKLVLPLEALGRTDSDTRAVHAILGRGRGARGVWAHSSGSPEDSTGPDTARRRRPGDCHDRCDSHHSIGRRCRAVADPAHRRVARRLGRLRSMAAGADLQVAASLEGRQRCIDDRGRGHSGTMTQVSLGMRLPLSISGPPDRQYNGNPRAGPRTGSRGRRATAPETGRPTGGTRR